MAEGIYTRLLQHMADISKSRGRTPPNIRLFDDAAATLPNYLNNTQPVLWERRLSLMRDLATSLKDSDIPDHGPQVSLLIRLFDGWTWAQVCEFETGNVPYADGLQLGDQMVPFNRLMLTLLGKATTSAADAAHAASMLETMQAVVRLWLGAADAGVAAQAGTLLLDLLRVDRLQPPADGEERLPRGGLGFVWKRLFEDRDVYAAFIQSCSLDFKDHLSKNQKTLAQARLMDWLPKVAEMDWTAVSRSYHSDVESVAGVEKNGLLEFAALRMVDFKDDVLMHRCLIDFYADLLSCSSQLGTAGLIPGLTSEKNSSPALQYFMMHGVHERTTALYLQQNTDVDPVEAMFLYGPAANYIAVYASRYPDHFLASQLPKQITRRLESALDLSPGRWAHADSPKHDLHLIASLPRKALLPNSDGSGDWSSSPLSLLPSKSTNPDVLQTLATVFHGPVKQVHFPSSPQHSDDDDDESDEAAAARALYFHYLARNPRFWADLTSHADTVALKDLALAAIHCLHAVITADWSTKHDYTLPTTLATLAAGAIAIISPPALEYTLPYLLKPPQTFANLVGGRGDTESAVYKIAAAKFDALKALHARLETQVARQPGEGFEEIVATLGKRLADGPLSRQGEIGGRIETMEL